MKIRSKRLRDYIENMSGRERVIDFRLSLLDGRQVSRNSRANIKRVSVKMRFSL